MGSCVARFKKWKERAGATATTARDMEEMQGEMPAVVDPEMSVIKLEAYASKIAERRARELERQERLVKEAGRAGYGKSDKGTAATRATRLLHRKAVATYDVRLAIVESMRVHLSMARDNREDAGIMTQSMADVRAVMKDTTSLADLEAQRDLYHDTLRDLADFTRDINRLASPSETMVGMGGDSAVDEAVLEEELAVYMDDDDDDTARPTLVAARPSSSPSPSTAIGRRAVALPSRV